MLVESSGREKPGGPIIKNPMKVLQSQNKIKRRHSVDSVTSRASPHFSAPLITAPVGIPNLGIGLVGMIGRSRKFF